MTKIKKLHKYSTKTENVNIRYKSSLRFFNLIERVEDEMYKEQAKSW